MVVYKFKAPEREDIVVFKEPVENKVLYTKRVMGLPGEKINIRNGHLFTDGQEMNSREYLALGMIGFDTWIVPKKNDVITIKPGMNYNEEYQKVNFDIGKVQKLLMENGNTDIIEQFLPKLKFYVNGEETGMILDYLHDENILKKITSGETVEIILDEDCYFMLGDNTNGSYDSRFWGFVKDSRIRGKAVVRFWPLNRISLLKKIGVKMFTICENNNSEEIYNLEKEIFKNSAYTLKQIEDINTMPDMYKIISVKDENGIMAGYVIIFNNSDSLEIMKIGVNPEYRQKGLELFL